MASNTAAETSEMTEINKTYERLGIIDPAVRANFAAFAEPQPMPMLNVQVVVSSSSDPFSR